MRPRAASTARRAAIATDVMISASVGTRPNTPAASPGFSRSHHARAGEILASLDNVLAEKAAGMPGNIADAVNGCWQCHGSEVKVAAGGKLDSTTWPNTGIGRINPDGSARIYPGSPVLTAAALLLSSEFTKSGYDLKALVRALCNSHADRKSVV